MGDSAEKRILIVEDDVSFASVIKRFVESQTMWRMEIERRGDTAVKRILEDPPDLVVLDLKLPGLDGLSVCRQVRPRYPGPILMLTGLGTVADQVEGLEYGADDYVAKPADIGLLLARIKALLRRSTIGSPVGQHQDQDDLPSGDSVERIRVGPLSVDAGNLVASIEESPVNLTSFEFDLLLHLARHAGRVVSRTSLFRALRNIEWDGFDRSMDFHILNLRKKLGDDGRNPRLIKSVRGVGYLLVKDP